MSFHDNGGFTHGFTGGFARGFQTVVRKTPTQPRMAYSTWRNEEEYHRERIEREEEQRERRRRSQLPSQRLTRKQLDQKREQKREAQKKLEELASRPLATDEEFLQFRPWRPRYRAVSEEPDEFFSVDLPLQTQTELGLIGSPPDPIFPLDLNPMILHSVRRRRNA